MCRLYGFRANEPTRVECSLVHAQNALMEQSREDAEGETHGHGWGIATYSSGVPHVEKQAWAAYHGEHFRNTAARIYSKTVVAHVRQATVGAPLTENTHPFVHGQWVFAHNGTIPHFARIRERLLEATHPVHRDAIHGATDSEHIFRYLLSLWERDSEGRLMETLRAGLNRIVAWCRAIDPACTIGLNVLWTDGKHLVGSRLDRTLWYLERNGIVNCEICGRPHIHHDPKQHYRAVEVASEPITHERWFPVPESSVFQLTPDMHLHLMPLANGQDA